jgi:hypothetical protein
MNINYNPTFIFPEIDLTKKISIFFKVLVVFQIICIIIVLIIFYPMEIIFLYNWIFGNYSISKTEQDSIDQFKLLIDNLTNSTLSCDNNNNLIINNNILASDISNNPIVCNASIKSLFNL